MHPRTLTAVLLDLDTLWQATLLWACLELAFYIIICRIIHPRIQCLRQAPAHPPARPPRECLARMMDALQRLQGAYSPETFWSGWFKGAAHADICRDNVKHFICWAIWHVDTPADLPSPVDAAAVEATVQRMEKLQGKPFPPGYNPGIEHVAFTREPLHFSHRLLSFYVVVKTFQMLGHGFLRLMGHQRHLTPTHGLTYWHRPCQQEGPVKQPPLFFFHGISPGIWFYLPFLARLGKGREIIMLEVPHIVTQLSFEAPDLTETVESLAEILALHQITRCSVAGHSFGSIVAGWAAAAFPEQVQQLVLVDPVCLLLCLPDVAVNFLYRSPSANLLERSVKDLIDPSSEITVSHALRRHFWWYQNVCWLQDVKCPVVVALSSEDDIVPSRAIRTYVQRHYGMDDAPAAAEKEAAPPGHGHAPQRRKKRGTGRLVFPFRFRAIRAYVQRQYGMAAAKKNTSHTEAVAGHAGDQRNKKGTGRLVYWDGIGHGQMLVSLQAQDRLIEAINAQATETGLARIRTGKEEAAEVDRKNKVVGA